MAYEEVDNLANVLNDLGDQEGADAIDPDQFLLGGAQSINQMNNMRSLTSLGYNNMEDNFDRKNRSSFRSSLNDPNLGHGISPGLMNRPAGSAFQQP